MKAKLNLHEDECWVEYFCYYVNEGHTDEEADHLAWGDMKKEFPHLRAFDGVHPEPAEK